MNIWHDISPKRIKTDDFCAVIEITKGSKAKYELDKETGLLCLDRVLYTSTHYPANYGFIPRTYAADHDPLDVLVLCSENIHPLSLVRCYPIGVISMEDSGFKDEKIIAIPFNDPTYNGYRDIGELPKHIFDEMSHFFSVYKALEGKTTAIDNVRDTEAAKQIIQESLDSYLENYCR
ncbi:inorganic diphosphatase [Anaeromassilibacillus senegalensis]|uniref:inorganic diphosphatase n=1 Tax=Anaeromassilibacillus senegalensis TaxID=1673717 RepID=UPI000681E649|nr:inorganic diphosphatase [Anaeromassilibacillus senegalensis]